MNFWEKTLWEGDSPYNGKIKVLGKGSDKRLVASGYTQSRTVNKDGKTGYYWDKFLYNIPTVSENSSILILGLAAGTIAKLFRNKFSKVRIDGVEIDPLMVDLGKKHFYLKDDLLNITIEDADQFLDKSKGKYQVVCVDLFFGEPSAKLVGSKKFFDKVRDKLKKRGVVIVNKICTDREDDKEYTNLLRKVFTEIEVKRERGNKYEQNVIFYGRL